MFITIYTDASLKVQEKRAQIAWRGKCSDGVIEGSALIKSTDINHAEMCAIWYAIADALEKFPDLEGFFVNADNLSCVRAFWTFGNYKCPHPAKGVFAEIASLVETRWVRAKHVKAHTGKKDIRSHMNRTVDRMTRAKREHRHPTGMNILSAGRDKFGRKHGWESGLGNGAINWEHGRMTYCDDGNGNEWTEGIDDDRFEYED